MEPEPDHNFPLTNIEQARELAKLVVDDGTAINRCGEIALEFVTNSSILRQINSMIESHRYVEAIVGMLTYWMSSKGDGATFQSLLGILRSNELNSLADRVTAKAECIRNTRPAPVLKKLSHFSRWCMSYVTIGLVIAIAIIAVRWESLSSYLAGINHALPPKLVLPQKWWPERKELIVSHIERTTDKGELLIDELHKRLIESESKATAIIANKAVLVGMSGIGKTTSAISYAKKYEKEYDHVIWIESEGGALDNSFIYLGQRLNFSRESYLKTEELVMDIYMKLADVRCLFIFDNAERYKGENGLKLYLPRDELHHAIITSINKDWGDPNQFGEIPLFGLAVFSKWECIRLVRTTLEKYGKLEDESGMVELGTELGFLPLALQLAIATIAKSSYNVNTYLQRYRKNATILVDKRGLDQYERSITRAMRLSLEQMRRDPEMKDELRDWCNNALILSAYSLPNDIPMEMFLKFPNASHDVVTDCLDKLVEYSLITKEPKTTYGNQSFSMHRLLQQVMKQEELGGKETVVKVLASGLFKSEKAIYASCEPEIQTVVMPASTDPNAVQYPRCVRLKRCGGCCASDLLSCESIMSEPTEVQVQIFLYNDESEKLEYSGTETVTTYIDTTCKCNCKLKAKDCSPRQEYINEECVCTCKRSPEYELCIQQPNKIWDSTQCECV